VTSSGAALRADRASDVWQASTDAPMGPVDRQFRVHDGIPADVLARVRDARARVPSPAPPEPSDVGNPLAEAARRPPGELMRIVVELEEIVLDGDAFQRANDLARAELVAARRRTINAAQASATRELQALGAEDPDPMWLTNQVALTVPARLVAAIAHRPDVVSVSLDSTEGGGGSYHGEDIKDATRTDNLIGAGFLGQLGSRSGGAQRIGFIDWQTDETRTCTGNCNWPGRTHVGWRDSVNGPSRLIAIDDCRSGTCWASTNGATTLTHATLVAWVALGSIEQGQDTNFPGTNTLDQRRRSGQAREAQGYYYMVNSCSTTAKAVQKAVADGVDVLNISMWVGTQNCANAATYDCGGLNAQLRAAVDAGVLVVGIADNNGGTTQCTLSYPGWRPDVLTVGGVATEPYLDYSSALRHPQSSFGAMPIKLWTGQSQTAAGVDLMAPYDVSLYFTTPPASYGAWTAWFGGTSYAAPAVAGGAALLREVFESTSWGGATDARILQVEMLLLGDRLFGSSWPGTWGLSAQTGYGRLRMHWPDSADLTAPWGWGDRTVSITNQQGVSWTVGNSYPESSAITDWKWAFTWKETNLDKVADIVIEVVDTCPAGGGEQLIMADYSFDFRKALRLEASQIRGKCLEMRAYGMSVPSAGRTAYSADYFHSGDRSIH
jgi:hypothetical protein